MANYPAYQPMNTYQPAPMTYNNGAPTEQYQAQPIQPAYPQIPQYQPMPYRPVSPIPQPQTMQQTATVPQVRGRIITREEEIAPNEVLMDGQVSLFPLSDYSCIVAKLWDSNGQIQTFKFVPLAEQTMEEEVENKGDMILGRLDEIESLLKKNNSQRYKKNQNGSRNDEREVNDA